MSETSKDLLCNWVSRTVYLLTVVVLTVKREDLVPVVRVKGQASLETKNEETSLFKQKHWPRCDLILKLSKGFCISRKKDGVLVGVPG